MLAARYVRPPRQEHETSTCRLLVQAAHPVPSWDQGGAGKGCEGLAEDAGLGFHFVVVQGTDSLLCLISVQLLM